MKTGFQAGDEVTPVDENDPWYGMRLEVVDIQQEVAPVGEKDFLFVTDSKSIRMFKHFELKYWHPEKGKETKQEVQKEKSQDKPASRSGKTYNPMRGFGDKKEDWPEEIEF
ncbi:MAG: hypothetical protein JNN15_10680 [Blastocatellia bacterium]|nr:hypothetical protein [Blastocatellia bacterium]